MNLSTFSTLHTAARGMEAARQQIAVAGQNTANAGTVGYSRQSVQLSSMPGNVGAGMFPGKAPAGQGVNVVGISRAASELLDRQVHGSVATSGFAQVRAEAYSAIEDVMREPGENSVSSALDDYHAAWQQVANHPGDHAATATLLETSVALASRISSDHAQLAGQWQSQHAALRSDVEQANVLASRLAEINGTIRQTLANGGSANEMMDTRTQMAEQLSALTGGQLRLNPDGTADFLVGGNAMVTGDTHMSLTIEPNQDPGQTVTVSWSHRPGSAGVDAGSIAGRVSVLGPEGPLVEAMGAYDALALDLAEGTNAVHRTGVSADGTAGGDFFSFDPARPAASLAVAVTSSDRVAHGTPGAGALDGTVADQISLRGTEVTRSWSGFVTGTGAASRSALDSLALAAAAEGTARSSQLSLSSVDLDEEAVNLVTFQHAFQASARVLTTVDEMLETLINRTGLVGR